MPIPKPDHRQSVELKFSKKEREFVDDWNLRQTVKAGGSVLSDLGSGLSSLISPFVSGGDAGLVMALVGAYIVDDRLDLKSRADLDKWLKDNNLYSGPNYGVYPSVMSYNWEAGIVGFPIVFCDPADFPEIPKYWQDKVSEQPYLIWPDEAFEDTYLDRLIDWMRTEEQEEIWNMSAVAPVDLQDVRREFRTWTNSLKWRWINEFAGQEFHPGRGGQWRSIAEVVQHAFDTDQEIPWLTLRPAQPALTYEDPPPSLHYRDYMERWSPQLFEKYRFNQIQGWYPDPITGNSWMIRRAWNNQISDFREIWQNAGSSWRYRIFTSTGGKPRSEIDSLGDVLGSISDYIPGAEALKDVISATGSELASWGEGIEESWSALESVPGQWRWPWEDPSGAPTRQEDTAILEDPQYDFSNSHHPMYVKYPVWATPPKSIYKFDTIHSTVEAIKVAIPWYLGTKFAIEGAKAAGSIIPG